jgi:hypothetical protein
MEEHEQEEEGSLAALARARAEKTQGHPGRVPHRTAPVRRTLPRWYRVAAPLLFVLGGILMVIGLWAVGAMLYMNRITPMGPEDVKYPLLRWSDDVGTSGGYAPESRTMALAMLVCIPLAMLMAGMVVLLRRQMRPARTAIPK